MRKVHSNSTGMVATKAPGRHQHDGDLQVFTKRIIRVLSYLSVSWPEVAENSRNGRMKARQSPGPPWRAAATTR